MQSEMVSPAYEYNVICYIGIVPCIYMYIMYIYHCMLYKNAHDVCD